MKKLIEKLDYQLFEAMFVKKDLEETEKLWQAIRCNPLFLNDGMEIEMMKNSTVLSFRAPFICFMILRFPASVPKGIYEKLVDTVIRRKDVASSIFVAGTYLDFLTLILENPNLSLTEYQKNQIMHSIAYGYGIEENKLQVCYNELLDMESPVVAKFASDGLDVEVSEYEHEMFLNGEVKNASSVRRYKSAIDYRNRIGNNSNFTDFERAMVNERINQDEHEFLNFLNYLIGQICQKYGWDRESLNVNDIMAFSSLELENKFADNEEALSEIAFVKKLVDNHYQKESSLVRKVN